MRKIILYRKKKVCLFNLLILVIFVGKKDSVKDFCVVVYVYVGIFCY